MLFYCKLLLIASWKTKSANLFFVIQHFENFELFNYLLDV